MKKRIKKGIALLCAALMLVCSVPSVPVMAVTTLDDVDIDYTQVDLKKICDIVLTQQGVVAKSEILEEVASDYVTGFKDGLTDIVDILTFSDTDACDRDTFVSNLDDAGVTGYKKDVYMNAYDLYCTDGTYSWLNKADNFGDYVTHGLQRYLVDDGIKKGTKYTVDDDIVNDVNTTFQNWWSENSDYYIYRVPAVSELPATIYQSKDVKESVSAWVSLIASEHDYAHVEIYASSSTFSVHYGDGFLYYNADINTALTMPDILFQLYDDNWVLSSIPTALLTNDSGTSFKFSGATLPDSYSYLQNGYSQKLRLCSSGSTTFKGIVSDKAHNVKIWKNGNFKLYDCGQQTVYFAPTYYNQTITNVTYTGDYYCDNSESYNYDIVQETINNTEGDITDSIVDSVVDQSVTNITNNYYYTDGVDGSGDDSDSDDGDGLLDNALDALGNFFGELLGVVEEIIDLAVATIIDALSLVVGGITSILDNLNTLKTEVSGLEAFFTAFFPYLPSEVWITVTTAIVIICLLAVLKFLKK